MAKRKKRKSSKKTSWLRGIFERKKKKRSTQPSWVGPTLVRIVKVAAVIGLLTGIAVGVGVLEKHVQQTGWCAEEIAQLELVGVPEWVNDQLRDKVYSAATADGKGLTTDPKTALRVQRNIQALAGWIDNVQVQTKYDRLRVKGQWRKPLALVKLGRQSFYVDAQQVVLEHVPMPNLPIVEVRGLSTSGITPSLGQPLQRDDLGAATAVLVQLDRMDGLVATDKPLLFEIDYIDVSNFNGRKNPRMPHILIYTKDNTPVVWGAEIGQWTKHLEATDQQKLAKLYGYYEKAGTLMRAAKYINLRDPQDMVIPLPIDKY